MSHASSTLEIIQMEVGLLQNFCEVIGCPQTREAALVDPAFEVDRLLKAARERGWTVTTILITHTHDDHIAGLDEAFAETNAVVRCHPLEVETVSRLAGNVQPVEDGDLVRVGKGHVRAVFTPGHMPGCVCWYLPRPGALITGDVLFVGSTGGVNYPQSDPRAMYHSLHQKLGALPEETRVYPGHDYGPTPTSTLMWEFGNNKVLTAPTYEAFCATKNVKP